MELVDLYLKNSRTYQVSHVVRLWNKDKVQATPEMAEYIEKTCGITRHNFDDKCRSILQNNNKQYDSNTVAEAILAFIIYCIDNQAFTVIQDSLAESLLQ